MDWVDITEDKFRQRNGGTLWEIRRKRGEGAYSCIEIEEKGAHIDIEIERGGGGFKHLDLL